MTDARYPESWLNDRRIVRLSDAGHRLFVTTLAWAASNRTDGFIEAADLAMIHGVDPKHATELVGAGLWVEVAGGFQIVDFHKTQTTKAQLDGLDHKRHQDRERKARERARKRGEPDPDPDEGGVGAVTRDVQQDIGRDTKARQGQARQGQASTGSSQTSGSDSRFWKQPHEMEKGHDPIDCAECGFPLNPALADAGEITHPSCAA